MPSIFIVEEKTRKKRIRLPYSDLSQSSRGCDMSGEVPTVAGACSVPVIGLTERTDAIVRGLVFLLEHHSASKKVVADLKSQLHSYLDTSSSEGIWLKRAKYVLTYPCAKFLRNELPPSPDLVWKPSGALRRWMKARMNAFCRKNVHLWYSWLQAKRCALSVSDAMITEAYDKHFKQLSQVDPCLSPESEGAIWLDRIFDNPIFQKVLSHVAERIEDLYAPNFTERTPSSSACYEATRSRGGQFQGLLRLAEANQSYANYAMESDLLDQFIKGERELEEFTATQTCHVARPEPRMKGEFARPYWIGTDELLRMDQRRVALGYNQLTLKIVERRELPGRFWWKVLNDISESRLLKVEARLKATIQVVLEPLKMRIISKGPAYEYYQMKPLQQAMHSALREMPCFRLLGRPMCPTDLIDLVPHRLDGDERWHSVDYSAATDGLSSEYGMRILDRILTRIDNLDRIRAGKVLGPHDLYYPQFAGGKWTTQSFLRGEQRNGQLMGGILSFPVLCLANLGVYLAVRQTCSSEPIGCDTLGKVLVNGDDMLYVGSQEEWDTHKTVGKAVGLEMSPGKAYVHSSFANANSTCFVFPLDKAGATPYQINYLNTGLVFGQHKVQARAAGTAESHHREADGCVPNIPAILAGCLPGKQTEVLRYVLTTRRAQIREDCAILLRQGRRQHLVSRNLFLPICFGGMGIDPPIGWKYRVKPVDRRLAASLAILSGVNSESPLEGYQMEKDLEKVPPWIAKQTEPSIPEHTLCHYVKLRRPPLTPWYCTWPSRGVYQE